MKHIIKKLITFGKKDKKEKKESQEPEAPQEEQAEQEGEKPPIDVKALLSGMADEMESRTMLLQGNVDEEKAGEIISGFLALADLKPPRVDLQEGQMPYDPITM